MHTHAYIYILFFNGENYSSEFVFIQDQNNNLLLIQNKMSLIKYIPSTGVFQRFLSILALLNLAITL